MSLHGVLANKKFFGDLAIAEALRDQFEYFQLARGYAQFTLASFVANKGP